MTTENHQSVISQKNLTISSDSMSVNYVACSLTHN